MLNEAVKKQLLSSREYFYVKRWEGKPWSYKFKFAVANYPELLLSSFVIFGVLPFVCLYKNYVYPNSHKDALRKYNLVYTVVRDDDPDIENIKKLKEMGREFFPK